MITRQGILRRMAEQHIEIVTLSEPRWSDACAEGRIEIVNVYNGDVRIIEDLALLTYATPRVPERRAGGAVARGGDRGRRGRRCTGATGDAVRHRERARGGRDGLNGAGSIANAARARNNSGFGLGANLRRFARRSSPDGRDPRCRSPGWLR